MVAAEPSRIGATGRRSGLYGDNPFRTIGVGTGSADADIRKRARELQMRLDLEGGDAEAVGRVRDALTRLQDPVTRIEAEITWVRLIPDPVPADVDPADPDALREVLSLLRPRADSGEPEAQHDLAVLLHAAALEDIAATTEQHRVALVAWRRVLEDNGYWSGVAVRARAASDPRLGETYLQGVRADVPGRILEASAACVALAVEGSDDARASELLTAIEEAGFPPQALREVRKIALGPLLSMARAALRDLRARHKSIASAPTSSPESALVGAWQDAASTLLPALRRLRGISPLTGEASVLADDIAQALDSLATRLWTETDRIDVMLAVSEAALEAAESDLVRENLRGELRKVRVRACWAALARVRAAIDRRDAEGAARALDEAGVHADDDESRAAVQTASRAVRAMRPSARPSTPTSPVSPHVRTPSHAAETPPSYGVRSHRPGRALLLLAGLVAAATGLVLLIGGTAGRQPTVMPAPPASGVSLAPAPPKPGAPAQPSGQPPPPPVPVPTLAPQPPPLAPTVSPPTPVPTATLEPILAVVKVTGGGAERVRLRQTPGRDGYVIDGLDDGEALDVIGEPREVDGIRWIRVRTRPRQTRGYVAADYLVSADATATPMPTATRPPATPTAAPPTPVTPPPTVATARPASTSPAQSDSRAPSGPSVINPFHSTPDTRPSSAPVAPRPLPTSTLRPQPAATRAVPTRTPTPRPATDDPKKFTGTGNRRTSRFKLDGGDYVISWRVRATGNTSYRSCSIDGEMRDIDDEESWDFESETARGAGEVKGETRAHDVPAGTYLIEVSSFSLSDGCSWEITVAPDRRR